MVLADGGPAVKVELLTVRRRGRTALEEVAFRLPRGAVTGLLGPSGSGRTTLMRALVGVQRITSGTVTVLGSPAGSPDLRRHVGYTTQAPSVYRDLSIEDNVRCFAAVQGRDRRAAAEAIGAVGLADIGGRRVSDLSGGQTGRVSPACALVGRPCWSSTNRPWDWAPCCGPTCGHGSATRPPPERSSSSPAMSWRRPATATCCCSCEGRVPVRLTPAELRRGGGSDDLEPAFLHLIRSRTGTAG